MHHGTTMGLPKSAYPILGGQTILYVMGSGLDDAHNSNILNKEVSFDGEDGTLRYLLSSKGM
jgi:hypothetical protein